jgi:hypothetical protein
MKNHRMVVVMSADENKIAISKGIDTNHGVREPTNTFFIYDIRKNQF